MLKVYTYNIRSVLEYATQVWQDIPAYLSDAIDIYTKNSLKNNISKLKLSTSSDLDQANLTSLVDCRIFICKKLKADIRKASHPISFLPPQVMTRFILYRLRSGNSKTTTTMKRTKRANDFFTFRFS